MLRLLCGLWLSAVGVGFASLYHFDLKPGIQAAPPPMWPSQSSISRSGEKPTLILFVHPRCSCSRASIQEFSNLAQTHGDAVAVKVVFSFPISQDEEWARHELWRTTKDIANVEIFFDRGAQQATLFGATTSGHTVLSSTSGEILFTGGITQSRGHVGPSVGEQAIDAILNGKHPSTSNAPTFGCHLQDPPQRNSGAYDERG